MIGAYLTVHGYTRKAVQSMKQQVANQRWCIPLEVKGCDRDPESLGQVISQCKEYTRPCDVPQDLRVVIAR